ncbi:MAG: hypothetical protein Q7S87_01280 [Agitococcus sp.]|nr:hypothetical protein [Agitococcus sp.]MDO9179158.1 hypothetical protein [Agitococcus sp.]
MNLAIHLSPDFITIDTQDKHASNSFSFALALDAYASGAGVGCQVNDEALRPTIEALCMRIATQLTEFIKNNPATPV